MTQRDAEKKHENRFSEKSYFLFFSVIIVFSYNVEWMGGEGKQVFSRRERITILRTRNHGRWIIHRKKHWKWILHRKNHVRWELLRKNHGRWDLLRKKPWEVDIPTKGHTLIVCRALTHTILLSGATLSKPKTYAPFKISCLMM